jgi:hypothetical protein
MRLSFHRTLQQLRALLWMAVWLALAVFLSIWSMLAGIVVVLVGIAVIMWRPAREIFAGRPLDEDKPPDPELREREARYVVTQVLRTLTQVQVSYLSQEFSNDKEALAWLKRSLPRPYRHATEELHQQLEDAKRGETVPGTALALKVMARREEVMAQIDTLGRVHKRYPDHLIANPVIFVITEELSTDSNADPFVVVVAGWNPSKPTLLPHVDALTFFSEEDGGRQIRGQAPFEDVLSALSGQLELVEQHPRIYAARPVEDPVKCGVRLSKVPLGFIVGTAELV